MTPAFTGPHPFGAGVVLDGDPPPPPPPPPPPGGLLRLGICASGVDGGPDWPVARAELGASNIKVRRLYGSQNENLYTSFYSDAVAAAANDCICLISTKCFTSAQFAALESQLSAWDPSIPFILANHHEPVNNPTPGGGRMTPAIWVAAQHAMLDMIGSRRWWHITPMVIWNGFWFAAGGNRRNDMEAQGGFPVWWPLALASRFRDMNGILGHDTYDGGFAPNPANPIITPGESPGVRITNMHKFARGLPWFSTGSSTPNAVSPVVMDRIGFGEIGSFDIGNLRDALEKILLYANVGCMWNKARDQQELADVSPRYTWTNSAGEARWGGNPNSHLHKAAYLDAISRATTWARNAYPSGP